LDPSPADPVSAAQSVPADADARAALLLVPTVHGDATHFPGLGSTRCHVKKSFRNTSIQT